MAAEVSTDVLVVGAGGAGMYAAISAARNGADVVLGEATSGDSGTTGELLIETLLRIAMEFAG